MEKIYIYSLKGNLRKQVEQDYEAGGTDGKMEQTDGTEEEKSGNGSRCLWCQKRRPQKRSLRAPSMCCLWRRVNIRTNTVNMAFVLKTK